MNEADCIRRAQQGDAAAAPGSQVAGVQRAAVAGDRGHARLQPRPGQEHAAVGQGAAHAFKFASVFGRSLVELVFDGSTSSVLTPAERARVGTVN